MKSCKDCRYCGVLLNTDKQMVQVCRIRPPVVTSTLIPTAQGAAINNQTIWPSVADTDWCGDHVPRLN